MFKDPRIKGAYFGWKKAGTRFRVFSLGLKVSSFGFEVLGPGFMVHVVSAAVSALQARSFNAPCLKTSCIYRACSRDL